MHVLYGDVLEPLALEAEDIPPVAIEAIELARVQGGLIVGGRLDCCRHRGARARRVPVG